MLAGKPGATTAADLDSSAVAQQSARLIEDLAPSGVACAPASGSFFPIGTITVTCTATDLAGNTARVSFDVIVNDEERPTISQRQPHNPR